MALSRFQIEFHVAFLKRWYEFRHGYAIYLAYAIVSILFTILTGVLSILIFNSWNESEPTSFTWDDLSQYGTKFAFYGEKSQLQPDYSAVISTIQTVSKLQVDSFDSLEDFEKAFFDTSDQKIYAFGLSAKFFNPRALAGSVYYNSTISDFEVVQAEITHLLIDILSKLRTQQNIGKSSAIDMVYDPLNKGYESSRLWTYFGPLLMSTATCYIGSIFANKPVEDRENYRLHSLLTSGMRLWIYWFATFVFDLCIYEVVNIINWLILIAFRTEAITKNNWMAIFFLFILQPIHMLPLVYTLSLFFDTLFSVSGFLQNLLLMVILIPYFIVTLVFDNTISDGAAAAISIVPPYCIQNGLRIVANRAVGKPLTAHDVWTDNFVILYAIEIVMGAIFAIIGYIVHLIKSKSRGKDVSDVDNEITELDEDVAKLEQEVLSGSHDDQAICVKNLVKAYVDSSGNLFRAVNDVSLYVETGEIFGVLGANGAGKSTLMSVITGRTTITSGQVLLFNYSIEQPSDAEHFVSICPQFDNSLCPDMTPRQHFYLYGLLKGYDHDTLKTEISEYEHLMNLGGSKDTLVRELSGGNARKLSIALAFLGNNPIIFLDEPTASLDPCARIQAQDLIEQKAHGRTILLCTHLLSEAEKLCNHICIMIKGRIHAFGTHQHLSDKYGKTWKVDLGLQSDEQECREKVNEFMMNQFPGCEIAGQRFASVTYNIPSSSIQLSEVFLILNNNKDNEIGYTYFTCSMSTLERVFLDIVMQAES